MRIRKDMNQSLIQADILDITFSDMGFIVFLKPLTWRSGEDIAVPIFIGIPEAQSIAIQFNKIRSPRPLIMDLFKNIFDLMQVDVKKVVISDLIDKTFYGKIYLSDGLGKQYKVDARSSDALIMALRFNSEIFIKKYIIEEAGILIKKEAIVPKEKTGGKPNKLKTRLQVLEDELKKALDEERYEEAAEIRDEIKQIKGETN
ncbi:MAG: bifunctional nuclease [Spirochaetae bacterium HGW-Spirochaetae-6]|nr:MAG: bifunctional nuclease [Spirochaetae bacterium HGW-Spirochaetae-6]